MVAGRPARVRGIGVVGPNPLARIEGAAVRSAALGRH